MTWLEEDGLPCMNVHIFVFCWIFLYIFFTKAYNYLPLHLHFHMPPTLVHSLIGKTLFGKEKLYINHYQKRKTKNIYIYNLFYRMGQTLRGFRAISLDFFFKKKKHFFSDRYRIDPHDITKWIIILTIFFSFFKDKEWINFQFIF